MGGGVRTAVHTPARARARPKQGHLTHVDSSILICAPGEAPLQKRCFHLAIRARLLLPI